MEIKEDQGCEGCGFALCLVFCGGVGEHSECVVFGGRRPSVGRRWPLGRRGSSRVLERRLPWRYRELRVYWVLVLISVGLDTVFRVQTVLALNQRGGERNQSLSRGTAEPR